MIGIRSLRRIGKGSMRGERCSGTRAESFPGVPGPIYCPRSAGFRAWSHRGPWAGPVG